MKNICLLLVLSTIAMVSCNSPENKSETTSADSTMATADSGWVTLFDGKTTTGWHSYGKDKAGGLWKIADGVLYLDTTKKNGYQTIGGGDLVTDKEYENFDFKVEWKIAPAGNSGLIFLINEDTTKYKEVWTTGPEMQIVDNDLHPDGKIFKHKAGDLYDLIPSSKESAKPVGEWNEAEIKMENGKLDLFLNGTKTVSTTVGDSTWIALVAGSKFKDMPAFGKAKKGKIALQDHGNMVSFRNIRIKEL